MACDPIHFPGVTRAEYGALQLRAQIQGIQIPGDQGATEARGLHFTWSYDEEAETLTLQCTEKPFFISCAYVEEQIRSAMGPR